MALFCGGEPLFFFVIVFRELSYGQLNGPPRRAILAFSFFSVWR